MRLGAITGPVCFIVIVLVAIVVGHLGAFWAFIFAGACLEERSSQKGIRPHVEALEDVSSFELFGGHEGEAGATLQMPNGTRLDLWLYPEWFSPTGPVIVMRSDRFRVAEVHCRKSCSVHPGHMDLGVNGAERALLALPLAGPQDAVLRYAEIQTVVGDLPRCPAYLSVPSSNRGAPTNFCTYLGEESELEKLNCTCILSSN